ncbi:hypothetical protein KAW48_10710 [candidate division WOR-3 bacterium]|nr:hypothetical protein [candidate division WOR-3 bacterium]
MFENIEQWRLLYFFSVYAAEIPLIMLALYFEKVWKSKIKTVILVLFCWFLLLSAGWIVIGSPEFDSFVHALLLSVIAASSFLVGMGAYYLWYAIARKVKDQ